MPASLGLIVASEEIVNSLFGYGSFSQENIEMTAKALKFFGYGVPAFSLIKVLSNFLFARDNTRTPFHISLVVVLTNILISLSFFKQVGFIIIPISTSISSWIGVLIYLVLLNKRKLLMLKNYLFKNIVKIITSTLLMTTILFYGLDYFSQGLEYSNKFKSIYLLFIISFVATFYLITCYLLGVLKIKNYKTD